VSHIQYAFAARLATADRAANTAAEFLALTGRVSSINDSFALLGRVTSDDVRRVARAYFLPANRTVVVLDTK
ncbi:MAG TPA: insulinase family protein, partial [Polyangia bacterium]|nr:insulinase family protein [Polyangia bacterium]